MDWYERENEEEEEMEGESAAGGFREVGKRGRGKEGKLVGGDVCVCVCVRDEGKKRIRSTIQPTNHPSSFQVLHPVPSFQ